MSEITSEILRVCEVLPEEKRQAVADFARFLLAQQEEEGWERRLNDPGSAPRLEAFLRESAKEADEPMDLSRL
ncbi:MAG: hypothetical protein RMK20_11060 [Verrucomicrobiales bacterium]|nr:hypothetical protein [Verrucomicrobiales bacterium]